MAKTKINKIIAGSLLIGILLLIVKNGCIFHNLTGFPCATCGMTRSFKALFTGNLKGAFFYHPLFWIVPLGVVVYIFKNKIPRKIMKILIIISAILILGTYIIRLFYLFPKTPPMNFYENAPIIRIVRYFVK